MNKENLNKKTRLVSYIKKFGFWGFMFFFLKGMVWLAVFAFGFDACMGS
ncbi:MAG: alanyl-tRNA synthetase [Flavobacteriia bacterium]|nr:alanyl-tRNA synthetase [Flavobacteriia bacterium]